MSVNLNLLPKKPGVYIMKDKAGAVIYVGKAKDIRARVRQYFNPDAAALQSWKIPSLVPLIYKIDFIVAASERDALILENKLIKQYQPFFNSMLKDAKTYPYIKLTMQEDYPRLLKVRRAERDGADYFGPYPHEFIIKNMLRMLWKNKYLPLRPCKWKFSRIKPLAQKKINGCIYYHTNQCPAPCAGRISYEDYRKIALRARMFFSGDYKNFRDDIAVAMKTASKNLAFEEAAGLRDFLAAIEHMKERVKVSKYREVKLAQKMEASPKLKRLSEVLGADKLIRHIEAFDNSHLSGKNPVGVAVCFIDGEKYKNHYRRFKIKSAQPRKGADDFLMMQEIVARRLEQIKDLPKDNRPDLFLIDGGPVQLAFAQKAIAAGGLDIKVIALAEREEEIFIPGQKRGIKLPQNDPARLLLMQIRDEAHRFAVTYNRLLRSKTLLN